MANVRLPNVEDGMTTEEIIVVVGKMKKTLDWLLYNLDLDNMPGVGEKLEDLNGGFSEIIQTVDQISLIVSDPISGVSALNVLVGEINASVADNEGAIASLTITANGLQTQVTSIDEYSQLIYNELTGEISGVETAVGTNTSAITQLSNEISSVVSWTDATGNEIASKINQTATTIALSASKIDLTGITTIYGTVNPTLDKVVVDNGKINMWVGGNNVLQFYAGLMGGHISSPSGTLISIEDSVLISNNLAVNGSLTIMGSHNIVAKFA